jgi:hypothetical protein
MAGRFAFTGVGANERRLNDSAEPMQGWPLAGERSAEAFEAGKDGEHDRHQQRHRRERHHAAIDVRGHVPQRAGLDKAPAPA